jgi:hypothetical protein
MAKKKKVQKKKLKVRSLSKAKKSAAKKPARRRTTASAKVRLPQVVERPGNAPLAKAATATGSRGVQTRFAGKAVAQSKEKNELVEESRDFELDGSDVEASEDEIPPELGGEN